MFFSPEHDAIYKELSKMRRVVSCLYRFMERVFIFCLLYSRRLAVHVTEIEGSRHRGSAVARIN